MRRSISRSQLLLLVLVLLSLIFGQLFLYQLGGVDGLSFSQRLVVFNHLYAEFMFAAGLLVLLSNGSAFWRILAYLSFVIFILIYSVQYISLYMTNEYLSSIAVANLQHIGLILSPNLVFIFVVLVASLAVVVYILESGVKGSCWRKVIGMTLVCWLLATGLRFDSYWLSDSAQSIRATLFKPANNAAMQFSPIIEVYKSFSRAVLARPIAGPLNAVEQKIAKEFGIEYKKQNNFPLIKDYIYRSELPFKGLETESAVQQQMNIIVFFSEGISARVIQPYNQQYPNLTPGFAEFAGSAMRVDNYYNHTFATYRGLLGQLCSSFPLYGGGKLVKQADYYCLGNILAEEGYATHFLFSQQKKTTELDELLTKAGVNKVLGQNDLRHLYLSGEPAKRPLALSDQQFMRASIEHFKRLEEQQFAELSRPFFVGLYNIETHAFYEISDDGEKYQEQDNYILDAIHNYDAAFANFWQYFKQSSLYVNTIVVLTSDHAHFQGSDFVSLVDGQADYKPYFVDKIPLIIYHPTIGLPESFDAKQASSLDFTPSVIQLLKLSNRSNSFLGGSIFERTQTTGIAYGESHIYLIEATGIKQQGAYIDNLSPDTSINQLYKVINNIQDLELQGRIWEP